MATLATASPPVGPIDPVISEALCPSQIKWSTNVKPRDPAHVRNTRPTVPASEAEASDAASWSGDQSVRCARPWSTEQTARVCAFREVKAAVQEMKPAADIADSFMTDHFYPELIHRVQTRPRPDCPFSISILTNGSFELATALHARLMPLFTNKRITAAVDYSTITVHDLSANVLASIDPEAAVKQQKDDTASPRNTAKIAGADVFVVFVGFVLGFFCGAVAATVSIAHGQKH